MACLLRLHVVVYALAAHCNHNRCCFLQDTVPRPESKIRVATPDLVLQSQICCHPQVRRYPTLTQTQRSVPFHVLRMWLDKRKSASVCVCECSAMYRSTTPNTRFTCPPPPQQQNQANKSERNFCGVCLAAGQPEGTWGSGDLGLTWAQKIGSNR